MFSIDWHTRLESCWRENARPRTAEVRGRDLVSGLPSSVSLTSADLRQAMAESVADIVDAVRSTLDQTPPELAGDIMDRGLLLTGGGGLLRGLDELIRSETGIAVHLADNPLTTVVAGAGLCVESFEALRPLLSIDPRRSK